MALTERGRRLLDGFVDRLPAMFKGKDGGVGHDSTPGAILEAVALTIGQELDEMEQRLSVRVERLGPP